MSRLHVLRSLVDRLIDLEEQAGAGAKAWEDGDDPCAMASCDPSDQFLLGEEAAEVRGEIYEITKDWKQQ